MAEARAQPANLAPQPRIERESSRVTRAPHTAQTLLSAAAAGDLERLQGLLVAGADVHQREPEGIGDPRWGLSARQAAPLGGFSALGMALAGGHATCARALVAAGAKLDPRNESDQLALEYVSADVSGETREAVGLKKAKLPQASDKVRMVVAMRNLFRAVRARDIELLRAVAKQRPLLNSRGPGERQNPMELAARIGDRDMVRALLDVGADVDLGVEHSPLGTAARHGHRDIVRLLIDAGADLNAMSGDPMSERKRTALVEAADTGHLEIVRDLLAAARERGVKLIRKGDAAGYAAARGHAEIVELLDTTGQARARATKIVAAERASSLVDLLDTKNIAGADALIRSIDEPTSATEALGIAVLFKAWRYVAPLLEKGADPNVRRYPVDDSPLHDAARAEPVTDDVVAAVRALVKAGAELESLGSSGMTPLARANMQLRALLLELGADASAPKRQRLEQEKARRAREKDLLAKQRPSNPKPRSTTTVTIAATESLSERGSALANKWVELAGGRWEFDEYVIGRTVLVVSKRRSILRSVFTASRERLADDGIAAVMLGFELDAGTTFTVQPLGASEGQRWLASQRERWADVLADDNETLWEAARKAGPVERKPPPGRLQASVALFRGPSWKLPALIQFGGWNAAPPPEAMSSVLAHWTKKHAASVTHIGSDTLQLELADPPDTVKDIAFAARDFYCFCAEGINTPSDLADTVAQDRWDFWWD